MLSKYDTQYAAAGSGYNLYGNNLIINNISGESADIDKNSMTSNSSSVKVNPTGYSHAFLIYMVKGENLNIDKNLFSALISVDGENYLNIIPETFGIVGKDQYVAIADISDTITISNMEVYLSLPLLEDTQNTNNVSAAGFYIAVLDSSGDKLSKFSLSTYKKSSSDIGSISSLGLGLKTGASKFLTNNKLRKPNQGFTAQKDLELGKSLLGDFGAAQNLGLVFLNSEVGSTPVPKVNIEVEQSSELNLYYNVIIETSISDNLSESKAILSKDGVSNYVENSATVPLGYPLSGTLSDESDLDPFSHLEDEININIINSSLRSKVLFSMMYSTLKNNFNLKLEYNYLGRKYILDTNRIILEPSTSWADVGVYANLVVDSKTEGELNFLFTSDRYSLRAVMSYHLPLGLAIRESVLKSNPCRVFVSEGNNLLECNVSFEEALTSKISIPVLFRLDPNAVDLGYAELSIVGTIRDNSSDNNISAITTNN
jgi:hypothetical protein